MVSEQSLSPGEERQPAPDNWDSRVWDPLHGEQTTQRISEQVQNNLEAIDKLRDFIDTLVAPEVLLAVARPELYIRQNLRLAPDSLGQLEENAKRAALLRWMRFNNFENQENPNLIVVHVVQLTRRQLGFHMSLQFKGLDGLQEGDWSLHGFRIGSSGTELPVYMRREGSKTFLNVEGKVAEIEALRGIATRVATAQHGSLSETEKKEYLAQSRQQSLESVALSNEVFGNTAQVLGKLLDGGFTTSCDNRAVSDVEMAAYVSMTTQIPVDKGAEVRFGLPGYGGYCRVEPRFNLATGKIELIQHHLRADGFGGFIEDGSMTTLIPMEVTDAKGDHIGGVVAHVSRYPDNPEPIVNFFHPAGLMAEFAAWQAEENARTALKDARVGTSSSTEPE